MALSSKAKDGLVVVDSLELKDAKTKALKGLFDKAGWNGKVLVIDGEAVNGDSARRPATWWASMCCRPWAPTSTTS